MKKRDIRVEEGKDEMGKTMNSVQMDAITDTGCLRPPGDNNKLIVYFEDLHMNWIDKYGDIPGSEVLRDLITTGEWFSTLRKSQRVIEDTNVVACIDSSAEQSLRVPKRFLFNFGLVGMEGFSTQTSTHIT